MVSIMRSEQTLRLIQLYHVNYPEIARNNQDADGRNLKLQMWAQMTEELNRTFETAFTVEQFKKKVQNVQCTSRQKLFSGKRNLGEAEVEYLRLFESDKISEATLAHRAKNRRMAANNSATDFLILRERHEQMEEYQIGKIDNGEEEEEEEGEEEEKDNTRRTSGGRTEREHGSGTAAGGEKSGSGEGEESGTTALSASIGTLFGAYGGSTTTESAQQMDMWTQQILLAMVNAATMNGTVEGGENCVRENGGERGGGGEEEGNSSRTTTKGRDRKRKQPPEETGLIGTAATKRRDEEMDEKREGGAAGEPSWAGELLKVQREVLGQQRQVLAHFASATAKVPRVASSSASDSSASSLSNASPASSSSPASPLPSSSFASHAVLCQCSTNKNGGGSMLFSLERELCARMDTTNAMLARIVELLLERLPPVG